MTQYDTLNMLDRRNIFDSTEPIKRSVWGPLLPFLGIFFLLLGQIGTLVPVFETGLIPEEDLEKYPNIIYMLFVPFSAFILLIMLWVRFYEGRTVASMGVVFNKIGFRDFRIGYFYGLFMAFVIVCSIWALGGYERESTAGLQIVDLVPLIILLFGFIVQSGAEEYLFRGWLFSRLAERYNVLVGIIVNALLFMLLHLPGVDFATTSIFMIVISISMTILFSVFLSLLVLRQKSIWGAAAWHAAWNWFFINGFGLATTGIELGLNPILVDLKAVETAPEWLSGSYEGPEGSILTLVILTIGCIALIMKARKG